MAVDPPTDVTPTGPTSRKTDSGEHSAADKFQIGPLRGRWSGLARAVVIVMSGAAVSVPALVVAIRAPSRSDVEKVKNDVTDPVNKNAALQAQQQAAIARMAEIIATYEKARKETAEAAPAKPVAGQRKGHKPQPTPETAKAVEVAARDLATLSARAKKAPAPKTIPVEAPKEQPQAQTAPPQQQATPRQQGVGGSNP